MINPILYIISEAVRNAFKASLNEGLSNILYHFTSLSNGYSICKEDTIYLQSAFSKDSDNYDKKRKFYLSCTRMFSSQFGYSRKFSGGGVRIKLDGDRLSQNFKGKAINYWSGMNDKFTYYKNMPKNDEELNANLAWRVERFKKDNPQATQQDIRRFITHNFNSEAQGHVDNESEDRIFSYQPSIENAHEYILGIDVLLPNVKEDKDMQKIAWSFLRSPLSNFVSIFDSAEQFNTINGKKIDAYDIEYSHNEYSQGYIQKMPVEALDAVIQFIAFANHDFDGEKFGAEASRLLQQYGLSNFSKYIGKMYANRKKIYTVTQAVQNLDHVRRELSDKPNMNNSRILKMLTDYLLKIGADSFRKAYEIKGRMADDYYQTKKVYDKIDTEAKRDFMIINYTIIPDPARETFYNVLKYVLDYDDDSIRGFADSLAYDITDNYDGNYKYSSKNTNSMFHFIYKLFRKGSIGQTLDALHKIGVTDDSLSNWGINISNKSLNYWDASRYDTLNTLRMKKKDKNYNDYYKFSEENDKEIEGYFPPK